MIKVELLDEYIKHLENTGRPVSHQLLEMRDEAREKQKTQDDWGIGSGGDFSGVQTIPAGYMNRY